MGLNQGLGFWIALKQRQAISDGIEQELELKKILNQILGLGKGLGQGMGLI